VGGLILAPSTGVASQSVVTPTTEWVNFVSTDSTFLGRSLIVGDRVDIYDPQGVLCGNRIIVSAGALPVTACYGDDPSTPEDEGALPGDALRFEINGVPAGVTVISVDNVGVVPTTPVTWGPLYSLWQITLGVVATPTPTVTPTATRTSTVTPTSTPTATVAPTAGHLYLPLVVKQPTAGHLYLPLVVKQLPPTLSVFSDLIVEAIAQVDGTLAVVIRNVGDAPVTDASWVDLYVNPNPPPTGANQLWNDLAAQGGVWAVTGDGLPIQPNGVLILKVDGLFYKEDYSALPASLPANASLYAQVDSYNLETRYGGVLESHEAKEQAYNNILGPVFLSQGVSLSVAERQENAIPTGWYLLSQRE
jgi:hypothetical protein